MLVKFCKTHSIQILLLTVVILLLYLINLNRYSYYGWSRNNRYFIDGIDRFTNKLISCKTTVYNGIIQSEIPIDCQ